MPSTYMQYTQQQLDSDTEKSQGEDDNNDSNDVEVNNKEFTMTYEDTVRSTVEHIVIVCQLM